MITLPMRNVEFPYIRIWYMPPGGWTTFPQQWKILPMCRRFNIPSSKDYGYELRFCERVCLPQVGRAEFFYRYGQINDGKSSPDRSTDPPSPADLTGYHIRIQAAEYIDTTTATPQWRTVYLGTVDSYTDSPWPSVDEKGDRTYHCSDLLYRTARWPMVHHSLYQNSVTFLHAWGHPGYNYAVSGYYRRLLGNKGSVSVDPFGDTAIPAQSVVGYICHTQNGDSNATPWSDADVVLHALLSSRAKGEPLFYLKTPGDFADAFAWPVREGEKCWDFINRVLSRQRGRGIAYLAWDDDLSGDYTSIIDINPYITTSPQNFSDIFYTKPSGGGKITINGAATRLTAITVDLIGDHRYVDDSLQLTVNDSTGVDYLETYGEQIETLVTLSGTDGTLQKRWLPTDETAFLALTSYWQRQSSRWRYVFQRWNVPTGWDFNAGDGNNGASVPKSSCFYYCTDAGAISSVIDPTKPPSPSPAMIHISTDIPIYEGYDYAANAKTRYDGSTDSMGPPRLQPLILVRQAADKYANGAEDLGMGMQVDDFGVLIQYGPDQALGTRFFAGRSNGSVGGTNDPDDMVISVGMTFGQRVRMASSNNAATELTSGRRAYLYAPGINLWLAHPGAIWEHSKLTATDLNAPAKRSAAGGAGAVPGIIRDDRDQLVVTHTLAWAWMGTRRISSAWALRDCGLLPDFPIANSTGEHRQAFPQLGQVVKELYAAGHVPLGTDTTTPIKPLTPITRIHYDHTRGVTNWVTDWQDLDTENL